MKRIFNILCIAMGMIVVSSCVDDEKLFEIEDFESGALPNLQRTANDLGFIDSFDFANSPIEFTIDFTIDLPQSDDGGLTTGGDGREKTSTEYKPVASVDLEVSYYDAVEDTTVVASLDTYNTWPVTVSFTGVQGLVDVIDILDTPDDINVGDVFTFVCGINFEDGTSFPAFVKDADGVPFPNYSVNFTGGQNNPGYDYSVVHNVSCSSDLGGTQTYTAVTNVTGSCCGLSTGQQTLERDDITVTEIGVGQYEISDVLNDYLVEAGLPAGKEPLVVIDVCNTITVDKATCPATSALCYIPNTSDPAGSYDPVTGVWVIKWEDAFGNGIRGVTTLTPN